MHTLSIASNTPLLQTEINYVREYIINKVYTFVTCLIEPTVRFLR